MKVSLALLALVAAVSEYEAETEAGAGYAPQEENEEYQDEPFSPGQTYETSSLCFTACPSKTPCLSEETGKCAAKVAAGYGTRYLSTSTVAPVIACPDGTVDSSSFVVGKTWPFWVGFGLLFLPSLWYLCITIGHLLDDTSKNTTESDAEQRLVAGVILLVASFAYFTMATGNGFITRCGDGRSFYFVRYIDWVITTPLMLYELVTIAEKSHAVGHLEYKFELTYLIFLDVIMIVAGFIGSLITSSNKWVFFAFSMLAFLPIMKQLCAFDIEILHSPTKYNTVYKSICTITILTWSLYPVAWILAEGTGVISVYGEAIFYTVLDVLAKSVFAYIILTPRGHAPAPSANY